MPFAPVPPPPPHQKVEYHLACGNPSSINDVVNKYLNEGWELVGKTKIKVVRHNIGSDVVSVDVMCFQQLQRIKYYGC